MVRGEILWFSVSIPLRVSRSQKDTINWVGGTGKYGEEEGREGRMAF